MSCDRDKVRVSAEAAANPPGRFPITITLDEFRRNPGMVLDRVCVAGRRANVVVDHISAGRAEGPPPVAVLMPAKDYLDLIGQREKALAQLEVIRDIATDDDPDLFGDPAAYADAYQAQMRAAI